MLRYRLLTSEGASGNGPSEPAGNPAPTTDQGTAGTQPSTQTGQQSSDSPSQPSGFRQVSEDEYKQLQRAREQVSGHDKFWSNLQQKGIKDQQTLLERVEQASMLEKLDPSLRESLSVLATRPKDQGDSSDAEDVPLTSKSVKEMLASELRNFHQEQQRKAYEQQVQQGFQQEQVHLDDVVRSGDLKDIFGEHDFNAAMDGKAGDKARVVARLLESELQASSKYDPNGKPLPITDRSVIEQAAQRVMAGLGLFGGEAKPPATGTQTNQPNTNGQYDHKPSVKPGSMAEVHKRAGEHFEARYAQLRGTAT